MQIQTRNFITHRDTLAPYRGTAVTVESKQTLSEYGPDKGQYNPAYYITLVSLTAGSAGEEGNSYSPAESTEIVMDAKQLDEYIRILTEHRSRMKETLV